MPTQNSKDFWMDIGIKLGQAIESTNQLNSKFDKFIENEHNHLRKRVEQNTWYIAMGMGGLAALQVVLKFLL